MAWGRGCLSCESVHLFLCVCLCVLMCPCVYVSTCRSILGVYVKTCVYVHGCFVFPCVSVCGCESVHLSAGIFVSICICMCVSPGVASILYLCALWGVCGCG